MYCFPIRCNSCRIVIAEMSAARRANTITRVIKLVVGWLIQSISADRTRKGGWKRPVGRAREAITERHAKPLMRGEERHPIAGRSGPLQAHGLGVELREGRGCSESSVQVPVCDVAELHRLFAKMLRFVSAGHPLGLF
jgi:hypothetical protein